MKKSAISIPTIFIVLMTIISHGQELPQVIPPSPTVANLMQFEEVPVSYYTGQPNISIPLYSKALNTELGINLALSYNTQGIKINNRSGWVGTGWSLQAGGVISRTVRGIPDESTLNSAKGVMHLDDYWDYETISVEDQLRYNWRVVGSSTNRNDSEVDLYQFNFLNYSGRFVIIKEGTTFVPKLISKSHNFKIEFIHTTNYVISSFIVTDAFGYKFTFDIVETTTSSPFTGSIPQGGEGSISSSGAGFDYTVNSAWHLSSIKTSNDLTLATFNYTTSQEDYVASVNRTYNEIIDIDNATLEQVLSNSYNIGQLNPKATISKFHTSAPTQKLSSIVFRDSTKVVFDLSINSHPETGGAVLDKIRIVDARDPNNIIENKHFKFDYIDLPNPNPDRLWLTKITETANGINHDYKFTYKKKHLLPGFDSVETDDWGYFSGIGSSTIACGNSETFSDLKITNGLLTSIEYPTGGIKEFVFEHNSYSFIGNQSITYNDYMENPRNLSTQSVNDSFSHQNLNSTIPRSISTVILDFEQDIYITSHITNTTGSASQISNYRIELIKNGESYSGLMELGEACHIVRDVPAGSYNLILRLGGAGSNILNESFIIEGTTGIDYVDANSNIDQEMIGGGVRIKDIIFKESISSNDHLKKVTYQYVNDQVIGGLNGNESSSGTIDAKQDRLGRNYTHSVKKHLFSTVGNSPGSFLPRIVEYSVRQEGVNVELSQGSYVGYRSVKVSEENNGHTMYAFTSPFDYPSESSTFSLPHSYPRENLDYKRGLLSEQKVYDNSTPARILKKVSNSYNIEDPNYDNVDFIFKSRYSHKPDLCEYIQFFDTYESFRDEIPSQGYMPLCNNYACIIDTSIYNCGGAIPQLATDFKSGWAQMLGTTTTEYFYDEQSNQTSSVSRQEFEYNTDNFQISKQYSYFDEKGTEQEYLTQFYYPIDNTYPGGGNSGSIRQQLIDINKINVVLETKNKKNNTWLSQTFNIYNDFDQDPNKKLLLPEKIKVGKGAVTPEERIKFYDYDDYGNPLEVSKTLGAHITYIWGYNDMYPIAKIENATYADVSNYVVNLKALSNADDDTTIGFVGNEGSLRQALDNLRNDLLDSQVTTFTYDPIIGVTSVTDPRGNTSYYVYDDFNRLKMIKDKDGNILSENEYVYRTQN
ncbi:RHS repeat domain-containing protein [Psychroserpens sp.]|uniref:RHS repeat domain-containing protein n=1 Tax=Psychroserpens sp. TaxID=2020870 RepID=UPI002B2711AD|nr:RHS repeat domain-containing protein [Psychroserpens sp.]